MKIATIVGARPQFIKAAVVSRVFREHRAEVREVLIHTGQHYDANMSKVFFDELDIPHPDYNLGIGGGTHGRNTGRMIEAIEAVLLNEKPDWMLVYGDTDSTLAGALAAVKQHIPIAHVEAGLRSHNPSMPEEINRVLTDRVSTLLLCPTATALDNLTREGFPFPTPARGVQRIANVGDVMYDAVLHYRDLARERHSLASWGLQDQGYALCTLHRQENTDDAARLASILAALREIARDLPVVLPLHPRTRHRLEQQHQLVTLADLTLIDPLPYLEMQRLQMSARVILTDSGGMQKEAYFHGVPCITLRDETEWVETVEIGWNQLAGAQKETILDAFRSADKPKPATTFLYGDGAAAEEILSELVSSNITA